MKTLLSIVLVLFTATAFAATPGKIIFSAYSTAGSSAVTCTVLGAPGTMPIDNNGKVMQAAFNPSSRYSRAYSMGRNGFGRYSTNFVRAVQWQCLNSGTLTKATNVLVYPDAVSAYFIMLPEGTWYIGQ